MNSLNKRVCLSVFIVKKNFYFFYPLQTIYFKYKKLEGSIQVDYYTLVDGKPFFVSK